MMPEDLSPDSHRTAHEQIRAKLEDLGDRLNQAVEVVEKVYDTLRHMTLAVQRANERADEVAQAAREMADLLWYDRGCTERLRHQLDRYKMLVDESPEARQERRDRETPAKGITKP